MIGFINHFLNLSLNVFLDQLSATGIDAALMQLDAPEEKRPHPTEGHWLHRELFLHDLEDEAVLLLGLHFYHRCGHCAAWLEEVDSSLLALPYLGNALVLVAPDNQINE